MDRVLSALWTCVLFLITIILFIISAFMNGWMGGLFAALGCSFFILSLFALWYTMDGF